jgi:TonB-linked SusC/RagA family outer membrane protein
MTRILSLFVVFMLTGALAFSQTRIITGTVSDAQGNPAGFTTVTEKDTKNSVTADVNGTFQIKVKQSTKELVYSRTGSVTKTVEVLGNRADVTLASTTNTELAGVTVVTTGLGRQKKKEALGYSTAKLDNREVTAGNAVNLTNGLTAKVSGLNVSNVNNGVLGSNRITLRNIRSLTGNNQPLLILDGLPIALSYLNSINPNDISDYSVLKSAASTAIYGPDGVNGAIVVTTKKGNRGKPVITISNATQFEQIAYFPKFQTRFGSGYDQQTSTTYTGKFEPIEQQSWGPEFDGTIRQFGQTGPNGEKLLLPYSNVPNGRRNFFATGVTSQTDVSYSAENFYLSGQNVSIKGVMPGDVNKRRSFAMKAEKSINKFKAVFNVRFTNQKYNVTTQGRAVYYGVTGAPGQYDLGRFKDWRNDYFSSPDGYYTPYLTNFGVTPAFVKDNNRQDGRVNDLLGNVEFTYKANQNLNFVYRGGGTITSDETVATRGAYQRSDFAKTLRDAQSRDITATISETSVNSNRLNSEFYVNYDKDFKRIGLSATAGYTYRDINSKTININSGNLGFTDFISIVNRQGEPNVTSGGGKQRLDRAFARVGLDYDKIVFVEATGSKDRDSRLVPKNKDFKNKDISAVYGSVNTSILLHKIIPGLGDGHFIDFLKLRGSIGRTGSVGQLNPYDNEVRYTNGTFFPFGTTQGLALGTQVLDKSFKPEFVNTKEAGLEVGLNKGKINFEASYYSQNNTNQLVSVSLSNAAGYTSYLRNAAAFTNNGLELDLKLTPLVKIRDVEIGIKANYTYQTSKVSKIIEGLDEIGIGNNNFVIVGKSAYVFKLTDYIREPSTGKVIVDKNTGMPSINPNLTTFGKTTPDNIIGLTLNIDWKNIRFSAVGDYRTGNQIVSDDLGNFLDDNGISARSADNGRRAFVFPNSVYLDGGKYVENTNVYTSTFAREFYNSALNTDVEANYVSDGSFLKLREISMTYTFPESIFSSSKSIKGLSIGFSGRNLLTWLPKSNQWTDPEFAPGTGNAQGTNTAGQLPPTRIFGFNISAKF